MLLIWFHKTSFLINFIPAWSRNFPSYHSTIYIFLLARNVPIIRCIAGLKTSESCKPSFISYKLSTFSCIFILALALSMLMIISINFNIIKINIIIIPGIEMIIYKYYRIYLLICKYLLCGSGS